MSGLLTIYTDGGCTGNPGPGGWAAVILENGEDPREMSGGDDATTNNRMELTAVISALEYVIEVFGKSRPIEVHTDSQYVQKGISEWMKGWISKGWKNSAGKPVKNKDLFIKLKELDDQLSVSWNWVKGHAGNEWNERCDELAVAASCEKERPVDEGFETPALPEGDLFSRGERVIDRSGEWEEQIFQIGLLEWEGSSLHWNT